MRADPHRAKLRSPIDIDRDLTIVSPLAADEFWTNPQKSTRRELIVDEACQAWCCARPASTRSCLPCLPPPYLHGGEN
jgi:hypothetical protein